MNNNQAFKFYSDNKSAGVSALKRDFIVKFNVEESQFVQIRQKFYSLSKQKRNLQKKFKFGRLERNVILPRVP